MALVSATASHNTPRTRERAMCFRGLASLYLLPFLCFDLCSFFVLSIQAIKLFGVKAKWLLALECVLVCLVLTPLWNVTFNGMRYNVLLDVIFDCEYRTAILASSVFRSCTANRIELTTTRFFNVYGVIGWAICMGDCLPGTLPPCLDRIRQHRRFCAHSAGRVGTDMQRQCDNGGGKVQLSRAVPLYMPPPRCWNNID